MNLKVNRNRIFVALLVLFLVQIALSSIAFAGKWKSYVVKEKDSLGSVASFYGVSEHDLCLLNQLKKGHILQVGQTLSIPAVLRKIPNRIHEVKADESIEQISERYDVSIRALAMANLLYEYPILYERQHLIIPWEDGYGNPVFHPQMVMTKVRRGIRAPQGVIHFVQPGQSIFSVASAYNIMASKIARANGLEMDRSIYPERRFFIPGARRVEEAWADVTEHLPVHFVRSRNNRQVTLFLVTSTGDVDQVSRNVISELASCDGYRKPEYPFSNELLLLIQQVADRFAGHTLVVISGYRSPNFQENVGGGRESKHTKGQAIDFYVEGVSNWSLFEFISALPDVGAGYYPNSSFVHLDYREHKAIWIDAAFRGRRAMDSQVDSMYKSAQMEN